MISSAHLHLVFSVAVVFLITYAQSLNLNPSYEQTGTIGLELEDKAEFLDANWVYGQKMVIIQDSSSPVGQIEGEQHNSYECQTYPFTGSVEDQVQAAKIIKFCYSISKAFHEAAKRKQDVSFKNVINTEAKKLSLSLSWVIETTARLNVDKSVGMFVQINANIDLIRFFSNGFRDPLLTSTSFLQDNKDMEYDITLSSDLVTAFKLQLGKPLRRHPNGISPAAPYCDRFVDLNDEAKAIDKEIEGNKMTDPGLIKSLWNWMPKFKPKASDIKVCAFFDESLWETNMNYRGRGVLPWVVKPGEGVFGTVELRRSAVNLARPLTYYSYMISSNMDNGIHKFLDRTKEFLRKYTGPWDMPEVTPRIETDTDRKKRDAWARSSMNPDAKY